MIVIETENFLVTFDVIDTGAGLPSLVEATKAIRQTMGWGLGECLEAARILLENKSITLAKTIEIGA